MSKHSFMGFLITFVVIIVVISLYYNFSAKDAVEPAFDDDVVTTEPTTTTSPKPSDNSSNNTNNRVVENNGAPTNTFTYTNEFGSGDKTTTVNAVQAEKLSGFSGASNNVFYIEDIFKIF